MRFYVSSPPKDIIHTLNELIYDPVCAAEGVLARWRFARNNPAASRGFAFVLVTMRVSSPVWVLNNETSNDGSLSADVSAGQ
jgi:hypothetical protein